MQVTNVPGLTRTPPGNSLGFDVAEQQFCLSFFVSVWCFFPLKVKTKSQTSQFTNIGAKCQLLHDSVKWYVQILALYLLPYWFKARSQGFNLAAL